MAATDVTITVEPSAGYLSDRFHIEVTGAPDGSHMEVRAALSQGRTSLGPPISTYVDRGGGIGIGTFGKSIVQSVRGVDMAEDRQLMIFAHHTTGFTSNRVPVTIYAARMNMTPEQATKHFYDGVPPSIKCTLPILDLLPWMLYIPGIPILPGFAIAERS